MILDSDYTWDAIAYLDPDYDEPIFAMTQQCTPRVYGAPDPKPKRRGLAVAGSLLLLLGFVFGLSAMLGYIVGRLD